MWRTEETDEGEDLVYDGMEAGIAPSPHKGTANIQNANISTEQGEVLASFGRVSQTPTAITNGTLTPSGATDFTGPATLSAGQWISVSASTVTSINTTTTPSTATISYLAVAGGGGGGGAKSLGTNFDASAGGGGAGEVEASTASVSVTSYAVTIGAGGAGNNGSIGGVGTNGSDTTIGGLVTATGGGGGGGSTDATDNGLAGGSGGGGGGDSNTTTAGTGGTASAGFNGGAGATAGLGGGGGGAGAVGAAAGAGGGNGGAGAASSISGTSVTYGGGGGGGAAGGLSPDSGDGGTGGGGTGGSTTGSGVATQATAGTANTGGGGGGGGTTDSLSMDGAAGGSGIVIISYVTGTMIAVGGVITFNGANTVHTFTASGSFKVLYITPTNRYYVSYKNGTTYRLSTQFDPTGANAMTHGITGSVTFSTIAVPNSAIAKATEKYTTATTTEYRYYVLDTNGYVWMYDTLIFDTYGTKWMLPDPNNYSTFALTGLGILNGMVVLVGKAYVFAKPITDQGRILSILYKVYLNEPFSTHSNFAMVGNQGKLYYCDGNYIGEIFPTTSIITSVANIQSLCSYTSSTTTGTISAIVSGSLPYTLTASGTTQRIPAVFYTDVYGTQPTNLATGTLYYIEYDPVIQTFGVYAAITGGSAINIATGAAGNQFFTTFWPFGSATGNGSSTPTVQVSTQRVNLPANETATCMAEVGNIVLIGGKTSTVYPWNQIDATPSDFINLPENDVKTMINVNNMGYIFAGNKGNIYITNGSIASLALKVPDYCAGVPGSPTTYIEPVFTWGDSTFMRGRVYFSILDQTATKAGNCGGIWSFIPTGNMASTDVGLSLRLENQNSYGDYDGVATILIANEEQNVTSPQYWSWWQDSYSTGTSTFGVDYTNTVPVTTFVIETDLIPTGTLLSQDTFTQLEYKLSTNALTGDTVQLYYRLNSTAAWTSCGTASIETSAPLSGYYQMEFQKTQWLQFRAVCSTPGTTATSFTRLAQIRLR